MILMFPLSFRPCGFHNCFLIARHYWFNLHRGHQITVILWGETALAFEVDEVIELGNTEPVIIIFVDTLVKTYDGEKLDFAYVDCHI